MTEPKDFKELIAVFGATLRDSPISPLEMSWSLKIAPESIESFLRGEIPITDENEVTILRFIFKYRAKIPSRMTLNHDGRNYQVKIDEVDPLI